MAGKLQSFQPWPWPGLSQYLGSLACVPHTRALRRNCRARDYKKPCAPVGDERHCATEAPLSSHSLWANAITITPSFLTLDGDEYELVPKKSSPAVTQSELFDEESDVLPRTTRRRSLLDFIKAKPMIGVALLFGLGGSLACFGYTFWLSRQRFACPHWALQCQIASKVQLYVNNKATLQGFLSAVFGLSVFMLAYATYQMAETTIWPVVLRQSLKWKDIDVYLAASRGSIVATVEALLNIRGSRHLVVLFIVLAVALLLQANAIIVGYTFENVNIPTV